MAPSLIRVFFRYCKTWTYEHPDRLCEQDKHISLSVSPLPSHREKNGTSVEKFFQSVFVQTRNTFRLGRTWKQTKMCCFNPNTGESLGSQLSHAPTDSEHLAAYPLKVSWVCPLRSGRSFESGPHLQTRVVRRKHEHLFRQDVGQVFPTQDGGHARTTEHSGCNVVGFDPRPF